MKRVLLLGDSIRMGYDEYVKEILKDEFEVVYDDYDNGRFAAYTLWQANQFFRNFGRFDVVHWNNGYWDMHVEAPMKTAIHPVDEYVYFLGRILNEIRNNGATPVFATTTPILSDEAAAEVIVEGIAYSKYKPEWVTEYNEAAVAFKAKYKRTKDAMCFFINYPILESLMNIRRPVLIIISKSSPMVRFLIYHTS